MKVFEFLVGVCHLTVGAAEMLTSIEEATIVPAINGCGMAGIGLLLLAHSVASKSRHR